MTTGVPSTADDDLLTGRLLVGATRRAGTGPVLRALDPRTGAALEPAYASASAADVDEAARLAAAAFTSYRETSPHVRAAFLDGIAARLTQVTEPLVARVVAETGTAEPRARGELARTTGQLRLFAALVREGSWVGARIETALPQRTPLPRPDLRQRRVPLGPVAVFGASNFPLAFSVAGGDTASALAAGCPVVVKAHPGHPGTSEIVGAALARAVADAGLHEGVFSLLFDAGHEVGAALVAHPAVRAVGFTGSRAGGLALMAVAAARRIPVPVHAEMSSSNPVVLLPGALAARGAAIGAGLAASLTVGAGQLCTSPGLVLAVDGPGFEEFLSAAGDAVRATAATPMLGPSTADAYAAGVAALRTHPDVTEVATGTQDGPASVAGTAHLFTTTAAAFAADEALAREVFGACSLVVRVPDVADLPALITGLEGQLTATLHVEPADHDVARALLPLLEDRAGRIVVNGWPTGVDVGHAVVHGGPFPATSDGRSTSVGTLAIDRWVRPVAYQDVPADLLPAVLDHDNSLGVRRQLDGETGYR